MCMGGGGEGGGVVGVVGVTPLEFTVNPYNC